MVPFNLLAFVPFGVLLATGVIATLVSGWIRLAPRRKPGHAAPRRNAQILAFPAAVPRPRVAGAAMRPPAQPLVYAPTKLAG